METSTWHHEPAGYRCPFCAFQHNEWNDRNAATDLIVQRDLVFARVAPKWWPENSGGVLVIPNEHAENLYGLSAEVGHAGLSSGPVYAA